MSSPRAKKFGVKILLRAKYPARACENYFRFRPRPLSHATQKLLSAFRRAITIALAVVCAVSGRFAILTGRKRSFGGRSAETIIRLVMPVSRTAARSASCARLLINSIPRLGEFPNFRLIAATEKTFAQIKLRIQNRVTFETSGCFRRRNDLHATPTAEKLKGGVRCVRVMSCFVFASHWPLVTCHDYAANSIAHAISQIDILPRHDGEKFVMMRMQFGILARPRDRFCTPPVSIDGGDVSRQLKVEILNFARQISADARMDNAVRAAQRCFRFNRPV